MRALLFLLLLCLPCIVYADTQRGFLYQRTDMNILRAKPPAALPWAPPENPVVKFDVEVREAGNVYNPNIRGGQTGWFNLSAPAENAGIMMIFKEAYTMPIKRTTEFAPLDILLIEPDGHINQVVHNIKLNELEQDIASEKPILAFLFLQGGIAQKLSINAGDQIDNPLFQKNALVINKDTTRVPKQTAPKTDDSKAITAPVPRLVVPDIGPILQKKAAPKAQAN